jgi:hypothetical protein
MLGGAWNAQTVPTAYGGAWSVLWLAVVIVAIGGYVLLARPQRRWPGLGVAAVAGLVIAGLGVSAAGRDVLRSMISAWPGFGVLRDAQQFAAPLALAEAAGLGVVVAGAMNPGSFGKKWVEPGRGVRLDAAGTMLGLAAILAPVLLLPGLAWGATGRLRPAAYPAGWLAAARDLDASAARGDVLLLPWQTYRTWAWNHDEAVLDPWTRLLSRPLIWNDGTRVGTVELAPDDPRAQGLDGAIRGGGPLTAALHAAGVRFVLDDAAGPRSQVGARLPGSVVIIDQPGLTVYQLPSLVAQEVGLARGDPGDLALDQAVVLLLGHRDGLAGQHQRDPVLDPVQPAQPRVVQHRVAGEVEQAALVDGAYQDVEQRVFQSHQLLPRSARYPGTAAGSGPASPEAGPGTCRDKVTSTIPATTIAVRRRPSLAGPAGRCS